MIDKKNMHTWQSKSLFVQLLYLLFLFFIFFNIEFYTAYGQQVKTRPSIGLALSGGGAKGMAHIGVLKILEKHNISIDYITGTSMGSIVGALYAIGYSANEIEEIALNINWSEVFEGGVVRSVISVEEKTEADKYLLEIPIEKGKVVLPKGVISGQKLEMLLAELTWSVHGQNDFLKFQVPFKCIATDIETGNAYVLEKGYLPDALRASMAIPSVFTPTEIDNKLLVDGGLVRNLPVSDLKKMGADIIIGVNVGARLYKKNELTSMLSIMDQASSFRNAILTEDEKKLCDILISPDIAGYSAASFDAIDSLIYNGEQAALEQEQEIIQLSKSLKSYGETEKINKSPSSLHSIFINDVRIEGIKEVSVKLIHSRLNIVDSSWVDLKSIEKGVDRIFGTNFFEKVNYRIIQNEKQNILVIRVVEKPFSLIKIGVNYNTYLNASLLLNGTFRNILGDGSKLLLSGKLSAAPEASIDYSIFTKIKPSIGFRAIFDYFNIDESLYLHEDSINFNLSRNDFSAKAAVVSSLSNSVYLAVGPEIVYRSFNLKELDQEQYARNLSYFQLFANVYIDTYDRTIYPNRGLSLTVKSNYTVNQLVRGDFPYDENYWKLDIALRKYLPIGSKFNLSYDLYGAAIFGDSIFPGDRYYMGGDLKYKNYVFPITGFRFMEYATRNMLIGGLNLRYEPWKGKYVFIHANGAFENDDIELLFNTNNFLFGAAIGIGTSTVIGPLEVKFSKNNQNARSMFWIQLGYYF
ncbi:MAG: patatin-like phospholipase family protein [Bacteroidota bacterium]